MNGFSVYWPPPMRDAILKFIEASLAQSWQATAELNAALTDIQNMLAKSPTVSGESRSGQRRVIFSGPVTVAYEVDVAARAVVVMGVGYHPTP